jgi:hypothetical protein
MSNKIFIIKALGVIKKDSVKDVLTLAINYMVDERPYTIINSYSRVGT